MFGKSEKRKGHPGLAIAVGALAVVGAVSIVNTSKRWVMDKTGRMVGFMKCGMKKKSDVMDFGD